VKIINNLEYNPDIGLNDHLGLSCILTVNKNQLKEGISQFNYNKGDYEATNDNLMDIDWSSIFLGTMTRNVDIFFKCTNRPVGKNLIFKILIIKKTIKHFFWCVFSMR